MSVFADNCEILCGDTPLNSLPQAPWLLGALQKLADNHSDGTINDKPMKVEVGFVDSNNFNAWAATVDDIDLIAINSCVYPILLGAFRGILCSKNVFPQIKSDYLTTTKQDIPQIGLPDTGIYVLPSIDPLEDPVREAWAKKLAFGAVAYILFHELAHVMNGHTSWFSQHGLKYLSEIPDRLSEELSNLQNQTLEYDADMSAVQNILGMAINAIADNSTNPATWTVGPDCQFGSLRDGVEVATVVVIIVHMFFSRFADYEDQDALSKTHPPAIVRLEFNIRQIGHVLNYRCGYDRKEWTEVAWEAAKNAIQAFGAMCHKAKFRSPPDYHHEYLKRYENFYVDTWETLRPELQPLVRSGYLAPTWSMIQGKKVRSRTDDGNPKRIFTAGGTL